MRLMVIAPFPLHKDRGSSIRARRLISLARAQGFEPRVFTFSGPAALLPAAAGICWQKILCDVWLLIRCVWFALRNRPEVIEGHLHDGLAIGLICRLVSTESRLVYNAHGTLADELPVQPGTLIHRLALSLEGFLERRAGHILVQSEHRKDEIMSHGVDPERVSLCPDAPEAALLDVQHAGGEEVVCVYTGSLASYQGVDDIIGAAALTKDIRYVIFGSPSGSYPELARRLGVSDVVEFVDPAPMSELPAVLSSASIALAPRRYGGNIPGKVPAYQAAGLPVIGTNVAGILELVSPDTGICVEPANPRALARAIQELAGNSERRTSMGEAARRQAATMYSEQRLAQAIRRAYTCAA